jgi:hypothetical protein
LVSKAPKLTAPRLECLASLSEEDNKRKFLNPLCASSQPFIPRRAYKAKRTPLIITEGPVKAIASCEAQGLPDGHVEGVGSQGHGRLSFCPE